MILKISKCLLELKEQAAAMKELETIPAPVRCAEASMILGKLYRYSNSKKLAIAAYKSVIQRQPLAIEAISRCLILGVGHVEISSWLTDGANARASDMDNANTNAVLQRITTMLSALRVCDHTLFKEQYQYLIQFFPKNVWLLQKHAISLAQADYCEEALQTFRQVRILDPAYLDGIHIYGVLLFEKGHNSELSTLANDILNGDSDYPSG